MESSSNHKVDATPSALKNPNAVRQTQGESQGLRLNVAKNLYGRSEELTLLHEAFQRVVVKRNEEKDECDRNAEIALVHGESGCGELTL